MKILLLVLISALSLLAQGGPRFPVTSGGGEPGPPGPPGAAIILVTEVPTTCTVGDLFGDTVRWEFYWCPVTNTVQKIVNVIREVGLPSETSLNACDEDIEAGRIYVNMDPAVAAEDKLYDCYGTYGWIKKATSTGSANIANYKVSGVGVSAITTGQNVSASDPLTYDCSTGGEEPITAATVTGALTGTFEVYNYMDCTGIMKYGVASAGQIATGSGCHNAGTCQVVTGVTAMPTAGVKPIATISVVAGLVSVVVQHLTGSHAAIQTYTPGTCIDTTDNVISYSAGCVAPIFATNYIAGAAVPTATAWGAATVNATRGMIVPAVKGPVKTKQIKVHVATAATTVGTLCRVAVAGVTMAANRLSFIVDTVYGQGDFDPMSLGRKTITWTEATIAAGVSIATLWSCTNTEPRLVGFTGTASDLQVNPTFDGPTYPGSFAAGQTFTGTGIANHSIYMILE